MNASATTEPLEPDEATLLTILYARCPRPFISQLLRALGWTRPHLDNVLARRRGVTPGNRDRLFGSLLRADVHDPRPVLPTDRFPLDVEPWIAPLLYRRAEAAANGGERALVDKLIVLGDLHLAASDLVDWMQLAADLEPGERGEARDLGQGQLALRRSRMDRLREEDRKLPYRYNLHVIDPDRRPGVDRLATLSVVQRFRDHGNPQRPQVRLESSGAACRDVRVQALAGEIRRTCHDGSFRVRRFDIAVDVPRRVSAILAVQRGRGRCAMTRLNAEGLTMRARTPSTTYLGGESSPRSLCVYDRIERGAMKAEHVDGPYGTRLEVRLRSEAADAFARDWSLLMSRAIDTASRYLVVDTTRLAAIDPDAVLIGMGRDLGLRGTDNDQVDCLEGIVSENALGRFRGERAKTLPGRAREAVVRAMERAARSGAGIDLARVIERERASIESVLRSILSD